MIKAHSSYLAAKKLIVQRYLETFDEHAAGTSRRKRSRTFAGIRSPSEAVVPTITVEDHGQPVEKEYMSELAERFWAADAEVVNTADAGVRLIVALKGIHEHEALDGSNYEKDKSKRT